MCGCVCVCAHTRAHARARVFVYMTDLDGAVAKSLANGLVDTGFASLYGLQP